MRRTWQTLFAIALTMTATLSSPLVAAPLRILWDDTHDMDAEPGDELTCEDAFCDFSYTAFAAAILDAGHSIFELDGFPGDLTASLLADYDVLMLFDVEKPYTGDEIAAIWGFVANGGSVLITGELPSGFNAASHNTLLLPYGLEFTDGSTSDDLTVFEPDLLTTNLTVINFAGAGVMTVTVDDMDTKVLGRTDDDGGGLIGFAYGAAGRVVVLSDSNLFTNAFFGTGEEEQLLANLLAHFMVMAGGEGGGPIEITIDIKPDLNSNTIDPDEETDPINPKSKGVVPVAILTTSVADGDAIDFDPWDEIDVETLRFGPAGASLAGVQGDAVDVDGDGDLDMMVHFGTRDTGVSCGDTELTLTAETYEGDTVTGTDSITTPGCK